MSSFIDTFTPDGKVEIKISDLKDLFKSDALSRAQNECMVNGLKANLPAKHILVMIGEDVKEEREENTKPDMPETNADWIRSMTDEELAEAFNAVTEDVLDGSTWDKSEWLKYLSEEREVKNNG